MHQLDLFDSIDIKSIRKQVLAKYRRVVGETDEEYNAFITYEVEYIIKTLTSHKKKPCYKSGVKKDV